MALAQAPVITAVLNGLGQPRICPGDVVLLYGTLPADAARNFAVTVGSKPGIVNSVQIDRGVTASISIFVPPNVDPGPSTVVLSHAGAISNAFPVNLTPWDPVLPLDPYATFLHNNSGAFVTPSAPAVPGEGVTVFVTGLGTTFPPLPLGAPANRFLSTVAPVTLTVAGITIPADFAGHYPLSPTSSLFNEADYEVSFTVPSVTAAQPLALTLTIGGVTSNPQTLFVGLRPFTNQPTISAVANGANFSPAGPFSAGSFVSIFGTGFGSQDNLSAFPATQVNGISVLFNGVPAPIFHLIGSQGQIDALIPAEVPSYGSITVVVQNQNGPSRATVIAAGGASPGIFTVADPGNSSRRNAAALIANSAWLVMPASQARALGLSPCTGLAATALCGQPARPGDFVQLYATGLGRATPNGDPNGTVLATGQPARADGPVYLTVANPTVTVGGQIASLLFSGLAPGFSGLYQVNIQVPAGIADGDNVPVQIATPGGGSDTATIAVSQGQQE